MKRVLFIGHDASRTGAPMVLLHLLRWLKTNKPEIKADLLLLSPGELEPEYRKVADVYMLQKEEPTFVDRAVRGVNRRLGRERKNEIELPRFTHEYSLVVGNTVVSLPYLELFKRSGAATISWFHELEYIVTSIFPVERFLEMCKSVDRFIVPSRAVEEMLRSFGMKQPMELVYEFSPVNVHEPYDVKSGRRDLGIEEEVFVVLGSGTIEWRKGVDLFLQVAASTLRRDPDIFFVWLGGHPAWDDSDHRRVMFDLERLGIRERIRMTGNQSDPHKYLAMADLFALTSREDPFPLVCLEAAAFGKPIVCFADAGGMPEFVDEDAGAVVPYGDIEAFADRIVDFKLQPEKRSAAGRAAEEKLNSTFSSEASCRKIAGLI